MVDLFGTEPLLSHTGTVNPVEALKDAKLIGIYFSMHHCPPCREFTPLFADVYNEVNTDGKVIEVVFCSGDKEQKIFDEYYAEMPWLALPKGDPRMGALATQFKVTGVPRLIVLKPDGTVVDKNGVPTIHDNGPEAINTYLEK